jgi:hypothetical protein
MLCLCPRSFEVSRNTLNLFTVGGILPKDLGEHPFPDVG